MRVLRQGLLPDAHARQPPKKRAVPMVPVPAPSDSQENRRHHQPRGSQHGAAERATNRFQYQNAVGYRRRSIAII